MAIYKRPPDVELLRHDTQRLLDADADELFRLAAIFFRPLALTRRMVAGWLVRCRVRREVSQAQSLHAAWQSACAIQGYIILSSKFD